MARQGRRTIRKTAADMQLVAVSYESDDQETDEELEPWKHGYTFGIFPNLCLADGTVDENDPNTQSQAKRSRAVPKSTQFCSTSIHAHQIECASASSGFEGAEDPLASSGVFNRSTRQSPGQSLVRALGLGLWALCCLGCRAQGCLRLRA